MLDRTYREILSEEEYRFVCETREFMEQVIAPHARQIDQDDDVPQEVF